MLTQKQIEDFHANGFLIMRGVFQGEELARLREAAEAVAAQGVAREGNIADHRYAPGPDGREVYWRSEKMWQRGAIFQAVTVHPDLLENIGQCVGQAFFPWNDSLVVKLAYVGAEVPWHQDPPYGDPQRDTVYPVPNFTTDIYLDHSGPDNGCVYAIPGHHLVGHVDLKSRPAEQLYSSCGAIPVEMEAGDVLFHCLSTPHGSRANRSEIPRRIFYIHYLADEVYQDGYGDAPWAASKPGWGEARRALIEEMICRRAEFGWETPDQRETLRFGEGGFTFSGAPTTPRKYWDALKDAVPEEEKFARKRLEK
jgi:ectoine hydroxylase-related dioxygenase (phytanoyl-CoA dioxygenase family)